MCKERFYLQLITVEPTFKISLLKEYFLEWKYTVPFMLTTVRLIISLNFLIVAYLLLC